MKLCFVVAWMIAVFFQGLHACRAEKEKEAKPAAHEQAPAQAPRMEAMSAEFMQKVMETSARIEEIKQRISDREQVLFETHPDIKAMRGQMVRMQQTINRILDEDEELSKLKMDRDILWSVMPELPRQPHRRPVPPGLMQGR